MCMSERGQALAFTKNVGRDLELYLYSPYGPYDLYRASVPVQGCTLPLLYKVKKSFFSTMYT